MDVRGELDLISSKPSMEPSIAVRPVSASRTASAATIAAAGFLALSFSWVYRDVVKGLVRDWWFDDNYSHGFLIIPIALFFAWESRDKLRAAVIRPSVSGLVGLIGSIGVLVAGILGAELFLSRVSLIGTLGSIVVFVAGWQVFRILLFPLAVLLLMVPIPAIIFNQITFPLQLLASRVGELALRVLQVPVLREGNIIVLANTSLEVAEACSGIRSLISLLTLGIVFGHFADRRPWARIVIALATIPVAVVANGVRVAGTGIAAHYIGPEAALGFFHTFSGWLVFVIALSMLFAIQRLMMLVAPDERPHGSNRSTMERK